MNVRTGVFCISPVCGLDFETQSQRGRTDEQGSFSYLEGETVTFSVGDLVLGSATAKVEMTPADLSFEVAETSAGLPTARSPTSAGSF